MQSDWIKKIHQQKVQGLSDFHKEEYYIHCTPLEGRLKLDPNLDEHNKSKADVWDE